jgi:hypothetical protein
VKRTFQVIVQGQFKKPLSFAELYTGQTFDAPLKIPPPRWIVAALQPLISALQPAVQIRLDGDRPYIISPLISTMQTVGR